MIAKDLVEFGFEVFTELGDNSKVDLIGLYDYKPYKFQVKAATTTQHGVVMLDSRKSGPNYHFRYEAKHADIFAIYVLDRNIIAYVSAEMLLSGISVTLRIDPAANNQTANVRYIADYRDPMRLLRDYTRNTQTLGDDIVQTTTAATLVRENESSR